VNVTFFTKSATLCSLLVVLTGCKTLTKVKTDGIEPIPGPIKSAQTSDSGKKEEESKDKVHLVEVTAGGRNQNYALQNALNQAKMQVISSLLAALAEHTGDEAEDAAIQAELAKDIANTSPKLVRTFQIKKPWTQDDKQIALEVPVSTSALMENKIVQDLLKRKLGFPKFAILIKNSSGPVRVDLSAFSTISQRFSKYGFNFVPGTVTASYIKQVGQVKTTELAETVYKESGARYMIIGNLTKGELTKTNEGKAVQVALNVEIIDGLNQQLLGSISEVQTGTGNSKMTAEKKGLKKILDIAFGKNKVDQKIYDVWLDSLSRFEKKFEDSF